MDKAQTPSLVILDESVNSTFFACDLAQCKGACCTLKGGGGAPVTEEECRQIESVLPAVLPLLGERSRSIIAKKGFADAAGDALRCIDQRDCVFVYRDGDIAKCAIERAFFDGTSNFRKPISCHLFPIRRTQGMYDHLRVEYFPECEPGYRRGAAGKIPLLTFLKDALVRAYGADWFDSVDPTTKS